MMSILPSRVPLYIICLVVRGRLDLCGWRSYDGNSLVCHGAQCFIDLCLWWHLPGWHMMPSFQSVVHPALRFTYFTCSIRSLKATSSVVRSSSVSDIRKSISLSVSNSFSSISRISVFVRSFMCSFRYQKKMKIQASKTDLAEIKKWFTNE